MRRDRGGRGVVEEKDGERQGREGGRRGVKRRAKSTGVQSAGVRAVRRNAGSAMKTSNQESTLRCTVYFSLSIYQFLINNFSNFIYIYIYKKKGVTRLNFKRYHLFFYDVATMSLIFIAWYVEEVIPLFQKFIYKIYHLRNKILSFLIIL